MQLIGLDWEVPDFSTLSRRQKTLAVNTSHGGAHGPLQLLIGIEPVKRHLFERTGEGASRWRVTVNGTRVNMAVPVAQ